MTLARQPEDLLVTAAELVISSGIGSARMLQRKLRTTWSDTLRLLARLEEHGVVGPDVGDLRDVLVTPEHLEATLERLQEGHGETPPAGDQDLERDNLPAPAPAPALVPLVKDAPGAAAATTADLVPAPAAPLSERQPAEMAPTDEPPATRPRRILIGRVVAGGGSLVTTLPTALRKDNPATRTVRRTTRASYVVGQGVWSWLRRATNASNHGHARQQLAMARLSGDPDQVEKWLKNVDHLRNNRIKRLVKLPQALAAVGVTTAVVVVAVGVLALVVGVLAALVWGGVGWHWWWWLFGWAVIVSAGVVVGGAALALTLAVPVTVVAAHKEGRKVADPPRWLLSIDERRGIGVEITPAKVAMALRDCGIPALRTYIKESPDAGGELLGPISIAGRGMEVDVKPPGTVSTDLLQAKRRRIAEALDRYEHELVMTIVGARTMRFWIADPGALDEPIGPSPLVIAGPKAIKASMKTGRCPWGETLRGDLVGVSLHQRHLTVAGLSNHGKTYCARSLGLWLAYDVKVEFRIADLKGVGDWDMFAGLATRYVKGPTDEQVIQATEMLEEVVEEMERRLASGRTDWDDLVAVVDEAQVAYMCPAVGADKRPYGGARNTSRFFTAARKLHNQGRAVNVVLWQFFQDPTDQNFPEIVREGAHIRIALVLGTESKSRMALGEAAVEGGAAPHLLRRDIDKGTVVMHGGVDVPRGESSITVRTYFIDDAAAWELARGAIEKRRKAGRTPLVIDAAPVIVDSLQDIYRAMGGEARPRTTVVLSRMREDNPGVYEDWSSQDFADAVNEYAHLGVGIRKYGGDRVLRIEEVEQALRERG